MNICVRSDIVREDSLNSICSWWYPRQLLRFTFSFPTFSTCFWWKYVKNIQKHCFDNEKGISGISLADWAKQWFPEPRYSNNGRASYLNPRLGNQSKFEGFAGVRRHSLGECEWINEELQVILQVVKINTPQVSDIQIPSRGLTYPTLGKGKSSSKCHFWGDMLVPWRVSLYICFQIIV